MTPYLGQVNIRSWRPAGRARLGQIEWTPIEAEAWLKQVTPPLRIYPECANRFLDRAKQIVAGLENGAVQYDDLITITDAELQLKKEIDSCLSKKKAAAETKDERTEMVLVIAALAAGLGLTYWVLS